MHGRPSLAKSFQMHGLQLVQSLMYIKEYRHDIYRRALHVSSSPLLCFTHMFPGFSLTHCAA